MSAFVISQVISGSNRAPVDLSAPVLPTTANTPNERPAEAAVRRMISEATPLPAAAALIDLDLVDLHESPHIHTHGRLAASAGTPLPNGKPKCRWVSVGTDEDIEPIPKPPHRPDDLHPCGHGGTLPGL